MTVERSILSVNKINPLYVDNLFSIYLYTATGAKLTIVNKMNLLNNRGLVWFKSRTVNQSHSLIDTSRGVTKIIATDGTFANQNDSTAFLTFNTNGFTLGPDNGGWQLINSVTNAGDMASWTFTTQPKFFDIVSYTGNGSARTISHNLGSVPGMIIVKRTDVAANWAVYNTNLTSASYYLKINLTDAEASDSTVWNGTAPTSSVFSVGTSTLTNANTGTYIAYIFAHDASGFGANGASSIIYCGTYTGNGSATGPTATIGWEPQYIMIKASSSTGNWDIFDTTRGLVNGGNDALLLANLTNAQTSTTNFIDTTSTGFTIKTTDSSVNANTVKYIYLAVRKNML